MIALTLSIYPLHIDDGKVAMNYEYNGWKLVHYSVRPRHFEDGQDDQRYLQRPKLYRKCQHKNSLYRDISSKGIEDGLLVLYYRSSWLCSLLPVFNCRARGCTFCHFCGLDCCFLGLAKSGSESKNAHNTPILEVWHPYRSTYMGFSCKSAHIWSFASLLLAKTLPRFVLTVTLVPKISHQLYNNIYWSKICTIW